MLRSSWVGGTLAVASHFIEVQIERFTREARSSINTSLRGPRSGFTSYSDGSTHDITVRYQEQINARVAAGSILDLLDVGL